MLGSGGISREMAKLILMAEQSHFVEADSFALCLTVDLFPERAVAASWGHFLPLLERKVVASVLVWLQP
jgi:hypothetical protein